MPDVLSGELIDFIRKAETSDPTYQAALTAALAVRGETALARAGLLPNLSFQAGIAGNSHDIEVAPGAFGTNGRQSFDSENFEFRAEQPLFRYDRWLKLKQVDRRIAQAEAEVAAVHADLVMKVSERYINVLGFQAEVKNSQAALDALLAQMNQTIARYELGVATEADLLEAQADSDRAAAELIKAQSSVYVAIDALEELTGEAPHIANEFSDELVLPPINPDGIGEWERLAAEQNAAVLAADMQVEIARYDRNIAKSGHLPTVGLIGKYGYDAQGGRFGETEITRSSIGLELQVPIFSGGGTVAQTSIAEHKVTEAQFRADAERRRAIRTSQEAFRRMVMTVAQARAARKSLESSIAARDALQAQYDSGARTVADLLEAEKNIFVAKKSLTSAQQQYILNSLRLRVASGTLSPGDVAHVDSLFDTAQVKPETQHIDPPREPDDTAAGVNNGPMKEDPAQYNEPERIAEEIPVT